MAYSLTEYLTEIQELTKQNYAILKALNDSFYTKSEHLKVNINNTDYVIPSFVSLENKLNTLEDNFENLVNAPRTGEVVFSFDGNTQSIEVKGFTNVPNRAFTTTSANNIANELKSFDYKKNAIFKDFLTPTPFVKIDLSQIPSDIQNVNVKKLVLKNSNLIEFAKQDSGWKTVTNENPESVCRPIEYSDLVKKLYAFEEDVDYVMYDKIYQMPIRYEIGNGTYVIKEIKKNWTDDNFFEHYELKLDHLTYKIADDTIEKNFFVGDYLITNNDKVKLLIEAIYPSSNTVQVKVENGGFADLCTENEGNVDLSTLKFFAIGNIEESKYLDIPLEEDQYIVVFIAPIQRNSLVQSPWGTGLFFNVFALTNSNGETYKDFYDNFVTNVGDKLFGIVAMAEQDFINIGQSEFDLLTKTKPIIDKDALKVTLINKHMSNSETISEIYNIYKQKEDYKAELNSVQKQIDEINNILSTVSFEDSSTSRTIYTDQLNDLNSKKKNLTASIANCIQQITLSSTDTDTPVENPKYHIRGFFNYDNYLSSNNIKNHDVIKIDVQYRYKNANKTTGNAESLKDNAIFSDWNIMNSFTSERHPEFDNGVYKYILDGDTTNVNVPSFNQIDIPISQGETVDIRLRVVYNIGYPFIKATSDWSEIINVEFPVELRKNVTVLDIIEENNSDTTKEAFRGYLEKNGVIEHVSDKLVDQDITYFHQPEHIASGFYTEERRVIPLRDKLQTITNDVISLKDEVYGASSDNLLVTLSDGESEIVVNAHANNTFVLKDFASSDKIPSNSNELMDKVETTLTLKIQNNSKTSAIKLFSLFPGNYNYPVEAKTQSKFRNWDYIRWGNQSNIEQTEEYVYTYFPEDEYKGSTSSSSEDRGMSIGVPIYSISGDICVPIYVDAEEKNVTETNNKSPFLVQQQNQWLYFRVADIYNNVPFYKNAKGNNGDNEDFYSDDKIVGYHDNYKITSAIAKTIYPEFFIAEKYNAGMCVFPHVTDIKDICITENDSINYKILYPGESVTVPITVMYSLTTDKKEINKTMSFDLRNSLYNDPLNFKFELRAKYSNDLANNVRKNKKSRYNPVVVN